MTTYITPEEADALKAGFYWDQNRIIFEQLNEIIAELQAWGKPHILVNCGILKLAEANGLPVGYAPAMTNLVVPDNLVHLDLRSHRATIVLNLHENAISNPDYDEDTETLAFNSRFNGVDYRIQIPPLLIHSVYLAGYPEINTPLSPWGLERFFQINATTQEVVHECPHARYGSLKACEEGLGEETVKVEKTGNILTVDFTRKK